MMFTSRKMVSTVAIVAALLSSQGFASDARLITKIDLDTNTGQVIIESSGASLEGSNIVPTAKWLTRNHNTFVGTLPNIEEVRGVNGWSSTGSYMTGGSWLPVDESVDFAHEITVTVPADQEVAATGTILSNEVVGDTRKVTFSFDGPSKLLGVFVGPYELAERAHSGLKLRTYLDQPNVELSTRYLEATTQYIERYQELIGPYPYDGFSVVSAPIPVGAAFPGLTYVGSGVLSHSYMTGRSLAHEILHNWWGNAVQVDYESGNWAEGITTYQADYALAEDESAAAARQMRVDWITALDLLADDEMKPLTSFKHSAHDGNQSQGYGKAAFVFHMLRTEIGDAAFNKGLQAFYHHNKDRKASWSDIKAAFEQSAHRDLSSFFEQWLTRPGLPHVALTSATERKGDHPGVLLKFTQSEPFYELTLPVDVRTKAGLERHVVRLSEGEHEVVLKLGSQPVSVQLDPDFDIARHPLSNELSPTLNRIFELSGFNARLANSNNPTAAEMRSTLDEMLPKFDLNWDQNSDQHQSTLVFGTTDELAALYLSETGQAFPFAHDGEARAWVDRNTAGKLTLYMSTDNLENLGYKMRFLGYYGSKSYVSFKDGRGHSFGVLRSVNAGIPVISE